MATAIARNLTDEMTDAHRVLTDAERELRNWQALVDRLGQCGPDDREAVQWQARRSARIVTALVAEADEYTRAARPYRPLKSVS